MSDLLALAAAAILMYVGVGLLALAIYDHVTGGSVTDREEALVIVSNWPTIAFIALVGSTR